MTRRRSLLLVACGALVADLSWLAVDWLGSAAEPPHVPHYILPSTEGTAEMVLGCGATSLWVEGGGGGRGSSILLEHDPEGARISDCVRHRSGGTINPLLHAAR